ncbi:MAG: hypothetical protein WCJ61_14370 [Paludibacter sp.]
MNFNINEEIAQIAYHQQEFEKFLNHSTIFIANTKMKFEEKGIKDIIQTDNSIEFKHWGLKFITKASLSFNKDRGRFMQGGLNTFLKMEDDLELIVSYKFDSIGNIEDGFTANNFALNYFVDFIINLINYSTEKDFKFQLN